jgi:alpha-D-xyloside xylohydrolase
MPVYYAWPADRSPLRTRLIEQEKYVRVGVEKLRFRERWGNLFVFDALARRGYRRGMASEEEMLQRKADGSATEKGTVGVEAVAPGVFRVRFALGEHLPDVPTPMTVTGFVREVACEGGEREGRFEIVAGEHRLALDLDAYEIRLADLDGRPRFRAGGRERNHFNMWDAHSLGLCLDERERPVAVECFGLSMDEGIYGFGETFLGLDKRGQTIDLTNEDACGAMTPRIYKSVPFYVSTRGYGVFVNQTARMTFWVGSRVSSDVQLAVDDDFLDYFIVLGRDMKEVLFRYTGITGRAPVPPKWSFGLWMSKITYTSEAEVMEVGRNLRARRLPCDVIHLDTGWFEKDWVCDLEFSKERFPDPKRMMDALREMGFRVSLWQQPYVREESRLFAEGVARGAFVRNARGELTPHPKRGVIDYSNPAAVAWMREKFLRLFALGAAAIKTDFGERIPDDGLYADGTPGGRMHNLYALLYNRAVFEFTREAAGEGIVWARSGTAGSQRYPIHWGGDNSPNFDNLEPSLCGGLSLGMCGFSFWSQDIGGFMGETTPELFVRWLQAGVFGSHARIHGRNDREPYRFGPEAERISREFLELRSRLMPYLLGVARASAEAGLPVMRPLALEFERDRNARDLSSEFMLGPSLLVAPILEAGATARDVYLPEGRWHEWWTGKVFEGGRWIRAEIPLDRTGLYVRAGSLVPLGPVNQYAGEHPLERVELHVYPGEGDLEFRLADPGEIVLRWDARAGRARVSPERLRLDLVVH